LWGTSAGLVARVAESPLFMLFSTACLQKTRIKCGENACIQLPLM